MNQTKHNNPHPQSQDAKGKKRGQPRYTKYTHLRVTIEFTENPTLGWELDNSDGVRKFPRDRQGNIFFGCRYWRGMISEGLTLFAPAVVKRHPRLMQHLRVKDVSYSIEKLSIIREFNRVYEQLPAGFRLTTTITYPTEIFPDVRSFEDLLRACGEEVGWAPIHSADGFGRFRVVEFDQVEGTSILRPEA